MKRLIYQVNIGVKSNLYDFCIESVKQYCDRYDIDHIVQIHPKMKIRPDMNRTGRNTGPDSTIQKLGYLPIYEKENAFEFLGEYDQVAIIDADIYIRSDAPNIFEEVDLDNHNFGGVPERSGPLFLSHTERLNWYSDIMFKTLDDVDWQWNSRGAKFMNMGVMVMNSSLAKYLSDETPKEFLSRPEFKDFIDGVGAYKYSQDQVLLNYWLLKEKCAIKYLNWKWNALYRSIPNSKLNEAYFVHFYLKQELPQKGENIEQIKNILGLS